MPAAPKTARKRRAGTTRAVRAQDLPPAQHGLPDLHDPRVRADIRRQGKLLAKHPADAEINEWIERGYDWDEWR